MPGEKLFPLESCRAYSAASAVLNALEEAGYEAHMVGGCVRDLLRGQIPADFDITTNARPEQVQAVFTRTVPTGIKHGTVSVLQQKFRIEVTTYRRESGYQDLRRPDRVEFVNELNEDLARRDFTVNAMAMDKQGRITDPFGGQADLAARIIRAVGDPYQRFAEDALRMLRAVRFAVQMQASIEPVTWNAVCEMADRLTYISIERIRDEWNKIVSIDLAAGMQLLAEAGMLGLIFRTAELPVEELITAARFAMGTSPDIALRHAALLYRLQLTGSDAAALLRNLRQPNRLLNQVVAVLNAIPQSDPLTWTSCEWKRYLYQHGRSAAKGAFQIESAKRTAAGNALLHRLTEATKTQEIWRLQDLAVTGGDIQRELSVTEGPILGRLLQALAASVLNETVSNTRQQLLEKGSQLLAEWNKSNSK